MSIEIGSVDPAEWEKACANAIVGPGEASWKSWKMGGGPHTSDMETACPDVMTKYGSIGSQVVRRTSCIVPYAGTESEYDMPQQAATPNEHWVNMIA